MQSKSSVIENLKQVAVMHFLLFAVLTFVTALSTRTCVSSLTRKAKMKNLMQQVFGIYVRMQIILHMITLDYSKVGVKTCNHHHSYSQMQCSTKMCPSQQKVLHRYLRMYEAHFRFYIILILFCFCCFCCCCC